ncbi:hypothetical protein PI125_g23238 [Phytophthora idaei]|nr:hypothetical protein PI125_g23238 [Phytophthora idaei]
MDDPPKKSPLKMWKWTIHGQLVVFVDRSLRLRGNVTVRMLWNATGFLLQGAESVAEAGSSFSRQTTATMRAAACKLSLRAAGRRHRLDPSERTLIYRS